MCKKTERWLPDFEKQWWQVTKEAYKIVFTEGKEKLEDVLSESESITNKSIAMISVLGAMFAFYSGFLIQTHSAVGWDAMLVLLYITIAWYIITLIFPKEIKGRGFQPKEFLPDSLASADDKDFQEEILYYAGIIKLQEDIQFMIDKNEKRAIVYRKCLTGMAILFVVCTCQITVLLTTLR